jgi:hypothetical protein
MQQRYQVVVMYCYALHLVSGICACRVA